MRGAFLGAGSFAVAALLAGPASGATINVNCAKHDLQAKINAAPPGSTLRIKGLCVGRFLVDENLTLDGNPKATLDAVDLGRTLIINDSPNVRLLDLTITGGHVVGQHEGGGGIRHGGGELTLRRVAVVGNLVEGTHATVSSVAGAGIWSSGGSLWIFDSRVSGNRASASSPGPAATSGGGIYRDGDLKLIRTTVASNRAEALSSTAGVFASGGGISIPTGDLTIASSRVVDNLSVARATNGPSTSVQSLGGGIALDFADELLADRLTVSGNRVVATGPGGEVRAEGGGFHGHAGSAMVRRSVFSGNEARARSPSGANVFARGGGLRMDSDNFYLVRSRVTGSVASAESNGTATSEGGGIGFSGDDLYMSSSRLSSNRSEAIGGTGVGDAAGGGLFTNSHSIMEIERATFDRNRADADGPGGSGAGGGGLYLGGGLVMEASTVSRNVVTAPGQSSGGGLRLTAAANVVITNSTVAGNRLTGATARGGGIDTFSTLTLTNSTLARNAARLGGGLYVEVGTTTLEATLLGLNTGSLGSPDCGGPVASAGRNLVAKTIGCAFVHQPSDKRNVNPRLGSLGSHGGPTQTILPRPGSPALNAIPESECAVAKDQRGVRRPQGAKCDIGAVERRAGRRP